MPVARSSGFAGQAGRRVTGGNDDGDAHEDLPVDEAAKDDPVGQIRPEVSSVGKPGRGGLSLLDGLNGLYRQISLTGSTMALANIFRTEHLPHSDFTLFFVDFRSLHLCVTRRLADMPREVNVLALMKGQERYVFVYEDDNHEELLQAVRDQAADPDLSLTWFDAMVLIRKSYEQMAATMLDAPAE